MSNTAIISSGDRQKDLERLSKFDQMDARLNAGVCANDCGPLEWADAFNADCPTCGFHWGVNVPYGKREDSDLVM